MLYLAAGDNKSVLTDTDMRSGLESALSKLGTRKHVLALPPDFTRFHSRAGKLTEWVWEHFKESLTDIMPATGTHVAMTENEIRRMFGRTPQNLFRAHDWRNDVVTVGTVPAEFIREVSEGALDFSWPAQVNKLLTGGGHDLILSIGQVVPHEVVGMANFNKNIFVGTGGKEGIDKSHYLGAVYGMERMMGRADTPVRRVLNYASAHFTRDLPIVYVLTVVGREPDGNLAVKGLFIGDDEECFEAAARLSLEVNFTMVDKPLKKVVVYLDPDEFKSTWLGDKSIYRTRMAIADGGELIVLAPGVKHFGEDPLIDGLIRKYGYVGTERILELTAKNSDLAGSLSAAAHLIHGSTEGRFTVTYCTGGLTGSEVEQVNYRYAELAAMEKLYDPKKLTDGYHRMPDGEEIFYISNPAVGLWASRDRFNT
ncbi:MAG TPA: lactate racemase domain-containing protein [Spirochaetia bacterium]|nr:lactate racemase domain-containing protein [Spirochaetia bacterium]